MRFKSRGIYPGTFDPVTNGHIDLIRRAVRVFDELVVAVAHQSADKNPLFSIPERVHFLQQVAQDKELQGRVLVDEFEGLVINYARKMNATAMVRGLRVVSDFEYEFQMALTNRKLSPDIETIFFMPSESTSYVSSRSIREVASLGGDISAFVPSFVLEALKKKYSK